MAVVKLGADRLLEGQVTIPGSRWGLVTNYTGVTSSLIPTSQALDRAGFPLAVLFAPEHGLLGTAQAGSSEGEGVDPYTGLPVIDTYRKEGKELAALIGQWNLDALLFDLQDIGVRFYTYVWTIYDCMLAAAKIGLPVYILDRPNPIGGLIVEGPGLERGFESFVGRVDVPIRHGLTVGELARVSAAKARAQGLPIPDPHVITLQGWKRSMMWADTGLDWVLPSPNMPTAATALVYVGTCLLEGTNISEGRGTTRPFHMVGAPWCDGRLCAAMQAADVGAHFREAWFKPMFSKFADQLVGGVDIYPRDAATYRSLSAGVVLLGEVKTQSGSAFEWQEPDWEGSGSYFIDLLWGSSSLRHLLDHDDVEGALLLARSNQDFHRRCADYLLYS